MLLRQPIYRERTFFRNLKSKTVENNRVLQGSGAMDLYNGELFKKRAFNLLTMRDLDFLIEVYRLKDNPAYQGRYLYRFIPVGTTYNPFNREPDFLFKGSLKAGYSLPIDYPVKSYFIEICLRCPPGFYTACLCRWGSVEGFNATNGT